MDLKLHHPLSRVSAAVQTEEIIYKMVFPLEKFMSELSV